MQLVALFQVKIIKWNLECSDNNLSQLETILDISETDLKVTSSPKSNKRQIQNNTYFRGNKGRSKCNLLNSFHGRKGVPT